MLEAAVAQKIEDQADFVVWWDAKVNDRAGRPRIKPAQIAADLMLADAEALTGIDHRQVSRWRRRLEDREKYQKQLYSAGWAQPDFAHA